MTDVVCEQAKGCATVQLLAKDVVHLQEEQAELKTTTASKLDKIHARIDDLVKTLLGAAITLVIALIGTVITLIIALK